MRPLDWIVLVISVLHLLGTVITIGKNVRLLELGVASIGPQALIGPAGILFVIWRVWG